jgi:sRNA-binding carbon storage regulator CsrA
MKSIKSFDAVYPVVAEATKTFSPSWKLNEERLDILKEYCDVIDDLIHEFDGSSIEVEIVDIKKNIKITIECPEITILSKQHMYYELVERSVEFGFSLSDDDNLNVKFVFPSVWEEQSEGDIDE